MQLNTHLHILVIDWKWFENKPQRLEIKHEQILAANSLYSCSGICVRVEELNHNRSVLDSEKGMCLWWRLETWSQFLRVSVSLSKVYLVSKAAGLRIKPIVLNTLAIWLGKASAIQSDYCLSNLHHRKSHKRSENARKSTNIQLRIGDDIFLIFYQKFGECEKFSSIESRSRISGLGLRLPLGLISDEVSRSRSVSQTSVSTTPLLTMVLVLFQSITRLSE